MGVDREAAKKLRKAAAQQRHWLAERDQLILQAHTDGGSLREIAELVGLSHVAVMKIVNRAPHSGLEHSTRFGEAAIADRDVDT